MKRYKKMLSLFVLLGLILFGQTGNAMGNKTIKVSMNGTKVDVVQVPVIMDGQTINTEFPSFVHTNRTLVPIRFVAENYGADVEWDQKTMTATVSYGDKSGKFTINSNSAIINGEKRILDEYSIPQIASLENGEGRTMVPLRFVTEIFGYDVGWDEAKNAPYINSKNDLEPQTIGIISDITIGKGSTEKNKINITSSSKIEYDTMFLQGDNKLVIDIKDSKLELKNTKDAPGTIHVDDSIIEKIQYSQFSYNPSMTRIVIKLNKEAEHNILLINEGKTINISFGNKVTSLTKEIINDKEAIVVNGTSKMEVNFIKLKNPERIVIDIMDSVLEGNSFYNYDYELDFIKGIRVSQFNVDDNYSSMDSIVRIVLDVKDGITDPNIQVDTYGDKIVIYPEKSAWENISYFTEGINNILTINNIVQTNYSVVYDGTSKNMEIKIPKDCVELKEGILAIKDGIVDEIQVNKGEIYTTLNVKFIRDVEYTLLSEEFADKISISLAKVMDESSNSRLIVVDAGHGGKDPGAISINKRNEKDLNLAISLKLNEALKSKGYNIIMTRDTDEFIDLYERAKIANDNNADIFISIHGNAHDNKSIAGIQVLYCPATQSENKGSDQHPFAKIIMDELLKATGAVDKGIIQRPKLVVLRETKMPAVLVETGFLSNSPEEKLLFTEEYQQKIVNGIIKGIEKYFESN